jgi:hypothetical protein
MVVYYGKDGDLTDMDGRGAMGKQFLYGSRAVFSTHQSSTNKESNRRKELLFLILLDCMLRFGFLEEQCTLSDLMSTNTNK